MIAPLRLSQLLQVSPQQTSQISLSHVAGVPLATAIGRKERNLESLLWQSTKYFGMRTTLNIDDNLLRKAKRQAAEEGKTLARIIEEPFGNVSGRQSVHGGFVSSCYHARAPDTGDEPGRQKLAL